MMIFLWAVAVGLSAIGMLFAAVGGYAQPDKTPAFFACALAVLCHAGALAAAHFAGAP